MHEIIALLIILLMFFVFLVLLAFKRWFYSWKGALVDKIVKKEQGSGTDFSDYSPSYIKKFILVFRTDKGQIIRRRVDKGRFKTATRGDRYMKLKRSWDFKKCGKQNNSKKNQRGSFFG